MATRVTESPFSDHAKINMILENANLEYKTFFCHDDVSLTFHITSDRIMLYERTKSQIVGTKLVENPRINEVSRKTVQGKAQPAWDVN
ncbi:hypothetical protein AMTR_s00064p00199460 [Amborella trichopoda]|uniref:Uncharacterized protein n=1 Tax=Amborella trichopoda TaxID=13333 RepID=U5DEH3_AMBTC|nr:hypothetical protein AMTR_s00064p00199460 [Amborella trichopoda]